jgi:hypothetical protein
MGVSFDEENTIASGSTLSSQRRYLPTGGMSAWLVKKGLAANQTSADLTLVLVIVITIILSFFAFKLGGSTSASSPDRPSIEQSLKLHEAPPLR